MSFSPHAAMEICTKIQYNADMQRQPDLDAERVHDEIRRLSASLERDITLPVLAEMAGVIYDTLIKSVGSKPDKKKDRRVSAELVTKLALVFGCSVEYLMGIAEDRGPVALDLNENLETLLKTAKTLPASRQRDLVLMAKTYAEPDEERMPLLLREVRESIAASSDAEGRGEEHDKVLEYLQKSEERLKSPPPLGVDDEETSKPSE